MRPITDRGSGASGSLLNAPPRWKARETMTTMTKLETPTLDRMAELKTDIEAIGDFLDWLHSEGYVLGGHQYHPMCRLHEFNDDEKPCQCEVSNAECWGMNPDCPYMDQHVDWLWGVPIRDRSISKETLVAKFYEIDLREADREKQAILDNIRAQNEARETCEGMSNICHGHDEHCREGCAKECHHGHDRPRKETAHEN